MKNTDKFRTSLSKVRGLGSAKEGTSHFIWQRLTAIVMIPLSLWFVASIIHVAMTANQENIREWLASGVSAALMIILLIALFYHAALGLKVVIEDYVHCHCIKLASLLVNAVVMFGFAIISILAVLSLHLHLS